MTSYVLLAVLGLTALLLLITAVRRVRRRRVLGGLLHGLTALMLLLFAGCALLIAAGLRTYQCLNAEQPAGEMHLTRIGSHEFNGIFTFPSGERSGFALHGDEWQVDARVLRWQGLANLLGFDTAYRLDRISGRYASIDDERSLPRTVYALGPNGIFDLWDVVQRYHTWVPWIDAVYGSATYVPMADGALYEIKVTPSGLMARPLNQAARTAVGSWQRTP